MRILENVAGIRYRIADHFPAERFFQKFGLCVSPEEFLGGAFDLVDFGLSAGFDAEVIPILFQQRSARETVLGHPFHKRLIRPPPCLAAIDDEIDVTILTFVDRAHARAADAAARDVAASSSRSLPVSSPECRCVRQRPQQ